MLKRKKKKAQEEMMGFVLIVLLVIIIGVVFFAFSLSRPSAGILEHKSGEMSHMLHAMLTCKTNCSVGDINQSLKEVIRLCINEDYKTNDCYDSCIIANETFTKMLDEFLGKHTSIVERAIHGYNLSILDSGGDDIGQLAGIGPLIAGNLTGSLFSVSESIVNPPNLPIKVRLRCYHVAVETEED